ncbi:MAG: T9SS type A sorting domain-containing protein [Calditrichaeota bacterium]|nr:T9SS type A sorting domain-containing protein [Calditrichota bacterium]
MKRWLTVFLITLVLATVVYAQQKDTVYVASDLAGEGNLNVAVQEKINAGTLSRTVFKLERLGYYIITGTITVPQGEHLEIVGPPVGRTQEEAPPQIVWTSSGGVATNFMFDCFGDLTMKNVWLRYANTAGAQVGTTIQFEDDPVANESGKGEVGVFEDVVFEYSSCPPNAGGAVTVTAKRFRGTFKNCYFRNCIDTHLRYYGRALSFPYATSGWHNDFVYFENCTFANIGYVYMQEGDEYGDEVYFNHCTFMNVVMFVLESGWWWKMNVTNSLFVNTYMFGYIPAQVGAGGVPFGGTIAIAKVEDFGFSVPFTEQDRRILFANNAYYLEDWLTDWMVNCPYGKEKKRNREVDMVPAPMPMLNDSTLAFFNADDRFPYMSVANLYNGLEFVRETSGILKGKPIAALNPRILVPPTDLAAIKVFLNYKCTTNADTNWAYNPDAGYYQTWPLPENLAYSNDTLKTAAMGGFPLGDLYHWWPEEYERWRAQADEERARILTWRDTGIDPQSSVESPVANLIPTGFTLAQNYPNPFNPRTKIVYYLPTEGRIKLTVYNGLGQKVATLVEGVKAAGEHTVTFDGSNLPGGVYLYRLQGDGVSLTRKFVLLK